MKLTALFCDPCHSLKSARVQAVDHVVVRSLANRMEMDLCPTHQQKFVDFLQAGFITATATAVVSTQGVGRGSATKARKLARAKHLTELLHDAKKGITLRELAKSFGESPANVSRVFHNASQLKLPVGRKGWTTSARYFHKDYESQVPLRKAA